MANFEHPSEDQAADRLAALGNRTRLRLFKLLVRAGRDGLNISDLQHYLEIPASTLAHHLATLARAGLVLQQRQGREVICTANYQAVNGLLAYVGDQCCAGVDLEAKPDVA